jgi:hypothetical protein
MSYDEWSRNAGSFLNGFVDFALSSDKYCMFEQNPLEIQFTHLKKYTGRFVFFQVISDLVL